MKIWIKSFRSGWVITSVLLSSASVIAETSPKPNILIILTDQQSASMMSCEGNQQISTPNMDRLAGEGIRFERAYATNPVCVPSRFSLMTGRMPSVIGMETNNHQKNPVPEEIFASSLGVVFSMAGYETVYAGKKHLSGSGFSNGFENPAAYGFSENLASADHEGREETVNACIEFLKGSHGKPFLMIASLINPHDICYLPLMDWVKAENRNNPYPNERAVTLIKKILEMPDGISRDEFIGKYCPPLPGNFSIPGGELPSFTNNHANSYIGWSHRNYSEKEWRLYRYLYARLTEVVDQQVGQILDAMKQTGLEKNTLIVFTSDHGDQNGSHQLGLKTFLYEESVNIPFILKWSGVISPGQIDRKHLVSNGLDLIPTLCDFAGIAIPANLSGKSLKTIASGKGSQVWRKSLVVETGNARLLLFDEKLKYMTDAKTGLLQEENSAEMLFNLKNDPGELKNLAAFPSYLKMVKKGREMLSEWYSMNKMRLDQKYINK